jgi:hypothetical protein
MVGAAFGTVPERLARSALRRDRTDLPPQFRAVNCPSTWCYREHGDRPGSPPFCRPRNSPCVTALDAGPYVLPGLSWQMHTRSLEAQVIEVKDHAWRTGTSVWAAIPVPAVRCSTLIRSSRAPASPPCALEQHPGSGQRLRRLRPCRTLRQDDREIRDTHPKIKFSSS